MPLETASRQGMAFIDRPNELPWHFVFLDKYAMAVTDPAPFHIELAEPAIGLAQSGEMLLKVKVVRHGDFTGPVEIGLDWLPPGVSKGSTVTIPKEKDEGAYRIQANAKAAPGVYRIAMSGSTTGGDTFSGIGRVRASSAFVNLKVEEPFLAIDLQHASVEQGKRGEIACKVRVNRPFEGTASVSLMRLPHGIKLVAPAKITAQDKEVVFQVEADPDALAGLYKEIACEVTVTENGQQVHQQTGTGVLRVDARRTVAAR